MKAAIALVGAPVAMVLLIGAAMTPGPTSTAPVFPADLPAAPSPFAGTSAGCSLPDPTGTGGCVTPRTAWLLDQLDAAFGPMPTTCWDPHPQNRHSDHPLGKACDITFGTPGTFPDQDDVDRGWVLAHWLQANAQPLGVTYVIWQGQIWSTARADEGWRPYTGGGVYDPTSPTGGHYDHVHVSVTS